jgi:hypothetical protein
MVSIAEHKMYVLNVIDDDLEGGKGVSSNDIPLQPRLSTSHCHVPDSKFDYGARNRLIAVLILCVVFIMIEIVGMLLFIETIEKNVIYIYLGGVISNSTAVLTDAVHMGIDVASFIISLAAMYLATKRPTKRFSFGYHRAGFLRIFFKDVSFKFFFRSTRSSFQCVSFMVRHWDSCLYGCRTLY